MKKILSLYTTYGAVIYDAVFRFGFLAQIVMVYAIAPGAAGEFFVVNSALIVGRVISSTLFPTLRYKKLIVGHSRVISRVLFTNHMRHFLCFLPFFIAILIYSAFVEVTFTLILITIAGIFFGFLDFLMAIAVARRDISQAAILAALFFIIDFCVFTLILFQGSTVLSAKLYSYCLAASACLIAYYANKKILVSRISFSLSFRHLLGDIYGGLFAVSLLLRGGIFPLLMNRHFDSDQIASFGLLNQVSMILFFLIRGFMNSNQRSLVAFYEKPSEWSLIMPIYKNFIMLGLASVFVLFLFAWALDSIFPQYNSVHYLPVILILFIGTLLYQAFNYFLIFAKKTGILLMLGLFSLASAGIIYYSEKLGLTFQPYQTLTYFALTIWPTSLAVFGFFLFNVVGKSTVGSNRENT